jgi:rubredoxin
MAAARSLGQLADPRAVEPLIARLDDQNHGVGRAAAISLGQIGDKRAVEHLIVKLGDQKHDDSMYFQRDAATALGEIGDTRASDALMAAARDPYLRGGAEEALKKIGVKWEFVEEPVRCPSCGGCFEETKGSPVSPHINVYRCTSCGWKGLRCGSVTCDGYLTAEETGNPVVVRYTCVKCGWTGTGSRFT